MKKMVIITSEMYPSQGILNLIKYISYCLVDNKSFNKKYNLKILIFNENLYLKTKKAIYNSFIFFKNFFSKNKNRIHSFTRSSKYFFKENKKIQKYITYFSKIEDHEKYKPYLVFPIQSKLKNKQYKSFSYIYDLQHLDLPKYFKKKEITMRNENFKKIIRENDAILVNSNFVKKGLLRNYEVKNKKIFTIPFLPYKYDSKSNPGINLKEKFKISKNFFIICNHFWKHKNHDLAFNAFSRFLNDNDNYILVCTGLTNDSRFPNYFNELKKKIWKVN